MEVIWDGIKEAFLLIVRGDPEIWAITWLTLKVSGIATGISLLIGLPLGTWLALRKFTGRGCLFSFINTGMAFPPVVIGLWVSIFLWRSGPLGYLGLIYTPTAMAIAQTIIATPIVIGLTIAAMQQLNPYLRVQLLGLGASRLQVTFALWRESRLLLLAALMAGFGSVISEVGASMMVGGNIKDQTRVLTTAIVLETSRGRFTIAIALGFILLLIAYMVNYILTSIQQKGTRSKEIQ
ncbi:MAG: ABC transporter permease [Chloroflexi bacterium]|nr:ABC transporter permease [Chloroflexota bacterium]